MDKIDGFLSKGLVALKRAATEVVDEFPDNKQKPVALPDVTETEGAVEFWSQLDLGELQERHKETLRAIQDQHSADSQAHLHNRALFAEKAYLSLTDKIINAPDPAPLLQSAATTAVALTEMEQSNAKLRQEMRSAQMDDAEVQQLLTRLRGAEKANAQLQEELEERKQSGREAAEVQEDLADAQQRARDLAQEVAQLQGNLQTWRLRCEKAQSLVFELSDARESVQAAQQQDGELTQSDLERAEARVQDLTRERNQLQARIQALEGGSSGSAGELEALHRQVGSLQEEALRRDEQIDALQAQLQAALSDTLQELEEGGDGHGDAADLSTRAQLLQLEVEELRQQLAQRPSQQQHEQVLREVEMLRAMTGAETHTADDAGGSGTSAADALQERGRQLSGEVAVLRSRLADAEGRAMQLQAQAQEVQQQLEQQQVQGRELEQQLHSLTESQGKNTEGLLAAVLSQRDRYRKQIAAEEEALSSSKQQVAEAEAQVAKLKGDNVALYQKIRYLESFAAQSQARSQAQGLDEAGVPLQPSKAARYSCGPFSVGLAEASVNSRVPLGGEGMRQRLAGPRALSCFGMAEEGLPDEEAGPEARYAKAYEEQLNPFLRFQNREQEGREGTLLPHDRALLQTSRLLLTSRLSRIFVALYAVMLHVFIMLLLYYSVSPHADAAASSSLTTGEDAIAAGASSSGPARMLLLARHARRGAL